MESIYVLRAVTIEDFATAKALIRAFYAELSENGKAMLYTPDSLELEMRSLSDNYSLPKGALLVAWRDNTLAGCIAMAQSGLDRGEIGRLYVRPEHRSCGVEKALLNELIALASHWDYRSLSVNAMQLYPKSFFEAEGFTEGLDGLQREVPV